MSKFIPGTYIGSTYEYKIGQSGVYEMNSNIYASLCGDVMLDKSTNPPTISVIHTRANTTPKIDDIVYFQVKRIMKTIVTGDILVLNGNILSQKLNANLKYENIKSDYQDFDIFDCFSPGDILLAKVISNESSNSIYLSTEDKSHGVVFGRSEVTNNLMMPISFDKMMCMDTLREEKRKVAKPENV
jgi:exosome complex RNA-binding protein Csl4